MVLLDKNEKYLWSGAVSELEDKIAGLAKKYGPKKKVNEGKKVSFKMKDIDGKRMVSESDFKGKTLVLNFFASWCVPCQKEIPHLNAFQKKADKDKSNIQVVGVLLDDDLEKAKKYLDSLKLDYPVYLPDKSMRKDKQLIFPGVGTINAIPATAIIDKEGIVKKVIVDMLTESDLNKAVKEALASKVNQPSPVKIPKDPVADNVKIKVRGMMVAMGAT